MKEEILRGKQQGPFPPVFSPPHRQSARLYAQTRCSTNSNILIRTDSSNPTFLRHLVFRHSLFCTTGSETEAPIRKQRSIKISVSPKLYSTIPLSMRPTNALRRPMRNRALRCLLRTFRCRHMTTRAVPIHNSHVRAPAIPVSSVICSRLLCM